MNKLHKALYSIIDQIALSGTNFLLLILLARWLTNDIYGMYAISLSVLVFSSGILNAVLLEPMSVISQTNQLYYQSRYLFDLFWTWGIISFISMISILIISVIVYQYNSELALILSGTALSVPGIYLFWFSRRIAYILFKPNFAARMSFLYGSLQLCILYLLFTHQLLSVFIIQLLIGVEGLIIGFFSYYLLIGLPKKINCNDLNKVITEHWQYGKWILLSSLLFWFSTSSYVPMIGYFLGLEDAGKFQKIQNLFLPLTQIIAALSLFYLPYAARQYSTHGLKNLKLMMNKYIIFVTIFTFVYILISLLFYKDVLLIIYKEIEVPKTIIFLFCVLYLIESIRQSISIPFSAIKRTKVFFWSRLMSFFIIAIIGIPLLSIYKILDVAILGLILSSSASLVILFINYKKVFHVFKS